MLCGGEAAAACERSALGDSELLGELWVSGAGLR